MTTYPLLLQMDPATGLAVAIPVLLVGTWVVLAYNRLVAHVNLVKEAWSGIDVQLKRRHDLVGQLLGVVREYSRFERSLLDDITRLRSEGERAQPVKSLEGTENRLSDRIRTLFAVAEAYPELRASGSFWALQDQLVEIEEGLQMARRYYNGTVRDHNIRVASFPTNLVARTFRFPPREFFQVEAATDRQVPGLRISGGEG